ncbi:MAG: mannose-1-phosphate guanylyltransferase/mannose-6-phosphate isomerase [Desulfovibrionaceae bacterium]|nr:mannose-1-phosphate guanylyltransferase/mannose-6-phosphate isomerase [Desulfovibrionaceae bacterium]
MSTSSFIPVPVILCGGSGTRLWPLSRELYPKQFMDLGAGRTLFADTLARAAAVEGAADPVIVCNETQRFYAADALCASGANADVILEPVAKNTAMAAALAALAAADRHRSQNPVLLIMPSDHGIDAICAFASSVRSALSIAFSGRIVTFGIDPSSPETGYGYIVRGRHLGDSAYEVDRFVEKPDEKAAVAMLQAGSCFWNSGIFLVRADVYLEELKTFAPDIFHAAYNAWGGRNTRYGFVFPDREAFLSSPSLSIDYAVMEHTKRAAVCSMSASWSDLGTWEAFYRLAQKDADGNVREGDALCIGTSGCYVRSSDRLVAALDVSNLAIVETRDAVLVSRRDASQRVREIVAALKSANRDEAVISSQVFRPWGSYERLAVGDRFQVKRITVAPGRQISLQLHHHRSEHWIVVEGTAEVINGSESGFFHANQSTYIPPETRHRLRNPGPNPLIIIEVQSGDYLGEDDIERFSDDYGRTDSN